MKQSVIQEKSYKFALRIIALYKVLVDDKKEYVLSKQLLRSGTSVGANVEEATGGQSERDFLMKISISYKEARETHYWLRLLRDSNVIELEKAQSLLSDCDELLRILGSIKKTISARY